MTEALLHFIWQYQLFEKENLTTESGRVFSVLHPGVHNTHAGADFQNAQLQLEDVRMAGNIELHIHQRDWLAHQHGRDSAYNNTILHVVYESDETHTTTADGRAVEIFELKKRLSSKLLSRYAQMQENKQGIPCEKLFEQHAHGFAFEIFLERLAIERLQQKVSVIENLLATTQQHWDSVAYQLVAAYLGAPINKVPFQQLTQSLPLAVLQKHTDNLLALEALLFGQAGFLDESFEDAYPQTFQKEYRYLKRLHQLQPLAKSNWKFLRLRPAAFPTVRLATLAKLLHQQPRFFASLLGIKRAKEAASLFDVTLDDYWKNHFQFDKKTTRGKATLGESTRDILLLNAITPLLFAYGKYKDEEDYCELAIDLLREVKAENNVIIRHWKNLHAPTQNALQTQALLQLRTQYCDKKRCLHCTVGKNILNG